MKFYLSLFLVLMSVNAFSGQERGGGDSCESRIQEIRNDIRSWIEMGGHRRLTYSQGITQETYQQSMLVQLEMAQIKCIGPSDAGYPIQVYQVPKICRFDKNNQMNLVTCDLKKFLELNEEQQYSLIHHEYAGLSDLEQPEMEVSTYTFSNQISAYLENVTIKKLAIKALGSPAQECIKLLGIDSTQLEIDACNELKLEGEIACVKLLDRRPQSFEIFSCQGVKLNSYAHKCIAYLKTDIESYEINTCKTVDSQRKLSCVLSLGERPESYEIHRCVEGKL